MSRELYQRNWLLENVLPSNTPTVAPSAETSINVRCELCGDSKRDKSKKRGYFLSDKKKDGLYYYCHNCNFNGNFRWYLKELDVVLGTDHLNDYRRAEFEDFLERGDYQAFLENKNQGPKKEHIVKLHFNELAPYLHPISSLGDDNIAIRYLKGRMIDSTNYYWNRFYYVPDVIALSKVFETNEMKFAGLEGNKVSGVAMLVYGEHGINGVLTRVFSDTNAKIRYFNFRIKNTDKYCGFYEEIDKVDPLYLVEGTFDAASIGKGGLSALSMNLCHKARKLELDKGRVVLIYDNQPDNKHIIKEMRAAIINEYSLVIWDERMVEKDINGALVEMFNGDRGKLMAYIDERTFRYSFENEMKIKDEFLNWSKVPVDFI